MSIQQKQIVQPTSRTGVAYRLEVIAKGKWK